ncbi:MAG: SDR family oxidoreductase [Rhodobacterales bacterium]|nr:SDR family oxidoreductase [Rhodobacterales bacterium]
MTENPKTLANGVAVVTGAGSGLGRALAIELASSGMKIVGFGRRKEALDQTANIIGPQFTPMVVDVAIPDEINAAFDEIAKIGPVTILINNAAVFPRRDCLEETAESFMHTININLGGTFACTRAALQTMTKDGFGRIVNISSFADIAPMPAASAYSVSKGAGRILTRALVADLGDRFPDIVISTWMPGMLATQMGVANGLAPEVAAKWGAKLALWHDRSLNNAVFEMNVEILSPRSLKRRIKDKVLGKTPIPRVL